MEVVGCGVIGDFGVMIDTFKRSNGSHRLGKTRKAEQGKDGVRQGGAAGSMGSGKYHTII